MLSTVFLIVVLTSPVRLMTNLGHSFRIRFEGLGESSDLDEAISMQRDAVTLP